MATHHLEVVPRIIDSSIAANYQKNDTLPLHTEVKSKSTPVESKVNHNNPTQSKPTQAEPAPPQNVQPPPQQLPVVYVPRSFTSRFFATVKDYFIPIVFIIAVIVIIYIVWTYFTKYQKSQKETQEQIERDAATMLNTEANSLPTIDKSDLEKYLDNSNNGSDCEDESDNESEESEEEEETVVTKPKLSKVNQVPSLETIVEVNNESFAEPDLDTISLLINQSIDPFDHHHSHLHNNSDRFKVIEETKTDNESEGEEEASECSDEESEDGELIGHSDGGSTESTDSKENEDAQEDLFSMQNESQFKTKKNKKPSRISV